MPDACDFMVDLQLKAADDFASFRVNALAQSLLKRLEDDCQDCGALIPASRRQSLPATTRCVYCQHLAELKEAKHAR